MQMKYWLSAAVVAMTMLSACSSTGSRSDASTAPSQTSEPYTDSIAPSGSALEGEGFDASMAAERNLKSNLVYFDFDQSSIKPEYQSVVDAYARYLVANPAAKVRLEGHADERGTREYNIGLGERRAMAVEAALRAQGVSSQQLSVISYGEERPAAEGHDEDAWALNRRVQIVRQ